MTISTFEIKIWSQKLCAQKDFFANLITIISTIELTMASFNLLYILESLSKGATIVSPTVCGGITKGDDVESLFLTEEGMQICTYLITHKYVHTCIDACVCTYICMY